MNEKKNYMICENCNSKMEIVWFKDIDPIKGIW